MAQSNTTVDKEILRVQTSSVSSNFEVRRKVDLSEIKQLFLQKYEQPVTSVYLNLTPDRLLRQPPVYLTLFDSLHHSAWQERQDYIDQLNHGQQQRLRQDSSEVWGFLERQFVVDGAKSVVIFKSGEQLARVYALPIKGWDYFAIDPKPYTLPMYAMLQSAREMLVVHVQQDQAVFYRYNLGAFTEVDKVHSNVSDISVNAGRDNKTQLYNYDQMHRHFLAVQSRLEVLGGQYFNAELVLSGDERIVADYTNDVLPHAWQEKLVAKLPYSPHQTEADWLNLIEQSCLKLEEQGEDQFAETLERADGMGQLVKGLGPVIEAHNLGLVRLLAADANLVQPGYICEEHLCVSRQQGDCPTCEEPLVSVSNVVNILVASAYAHEAEVHLFIHHPELVGYYDGIAAVKQDGVKG